MSAMSPRFKKGLLLCTLIFSLALTFSRRWLIEPLDYHSTIFADKAGYYIYLPLTFKYHFDISRIPENLEQNLGVGFNIHKTEKKLVTKYQCGVALMQLPFYLPVYLLARPLGYGTEGFSFVYQRTIDVCGAVYLVLGLFFLWRFLRFYFNEKIVFLSLLYLYLCTNLLYFGNYETGLSHVYSFFLVNVLLYKWKKARAENNISIGNSAAIAACVALIWLVRPINILFVPFIFLIDGFSRKSFTALMEKVLSVKKIVIAVIVLLLTVTPQILYNMYAYGKPLADSYKNEKFAYLFSPKILEVLFAFENGFFIYNPLYIIGITGMIILIFRKNINGVLILALFFSIALTYACWWAWELGCSLGHRGFVEFYGLLVLPFATALAEVWKRRSLRTVYVVMFLVCVAYNMRLFWFWDGCFEGKEWDYRQWYFWVFEAGIPGYLR